MGSNTKFEQKFNGGVVVATPGVMGKVDPLAMVTALMRHVSGDWNADLLGGGRLISVYSLPGEPNEKFWIITEADRSVTTFLLPEEY
jgi:hypothetical protein